MRYAASLIFVAQVLTGCSGPAGDPIVPGTEPTAPPLAEDTGWPPGDLGNFHIAHHVNTDKTEVFALASASNPGSFLNFAQCAILDVPCLSGIPSTEDTWKDVDLGQSVDRATIETRFLGFELSFGPYVLTYQEDPDNGFGFYGLPVDIADVEGDRSIGPTWGGQWKEYEGDDDLYVSRPIEVLNPAPGENIIFTNGQKVVLEWVPTGEGQVTMLVSTRFTISRLFSLEDDGYYEMDVDELALPSNQEDITFTFTRWNIETLRTFGHVVDLVATSDMSFTGQYYNIGGRDPIEPADDCVEAAGMPSLPAGIYWGWLGNKQDDLSSTANCLDAAGLNNGGASNGKDAVVKVELASHEVLSVEYNTYDESASVYLRHDCDNTNDCADGADLSPDDDTTEYVSYFNETEDPETLYLVLDSAPNEQGEIGNTVFTLDMSITPALDPPMYDSCLEAQSAYQNVGVELVPGTYIEEFFGDWVDDLNPGAGGCSGTSLGGADGMNAVEVGPGQTLTISVDMPNKDPGIYLLTDCSAAFSCVAGMDAHIGDEEEILSYNNTGAAPQTVYVVVDSKNGVGTFFMTVQLSP